MNPNITVSREEQIKKYIDSFPVVPTSVARLIQVTNDPESSAHDVMEVILPDQSLCITVLRIANSALFGRPKKVDSIRMAVAVLGFDEVQKIAVTKALINSFSKLAKKHKTFIDNHWTHSFVCGTIARVIANDLRFTSGSTFTAGLIHDIGKLIMLEIFSDDYATEYWMANFSNEKILCEELEIFSFTHDQIGGQLLGKWDFPENLISAVSNHHRPGNAGMEKSLALVIQLADILSFYCFDQDLLGDEDLITALHRSLPGLQDQWEDTALSFDHEKIEGWFKWLKSNYEEGCNLKNAFTA